MPTHYMCIPEFLSMYLVCLVPKEARGGGGIIGSSGTARVVGGCESPNLCWESNPGPWNEQQCS